MYTCSIGFPLIYPITHPFLFRQEVHIRNSPVYGPLNSGAGDPKEEPNARNQTAEEAIAVERDGAEGRA
jgi:hypothetical protein